jgi:hypothetical protein
VQLQTPCTRREASGNITSPSLLLQSNQWDRDLKFHHRKQRPYEKDIMDYSYSWRFHGLRQR